jgi:dolichol-phosphate mannosyltransferase
MSSVKIPLDTGDFRLMSRPVVDAFILMREQNRFIRGMVSWVGFRQIPVYYERDKRYGGDTKFTVFKMMRFAMDGILSFSSIPLQWITTLGFFISFFSFVCIVYVLYSNYILHVTVKGWTSTMVGILMLGGIQLTCLGMIGEYVARIFDEVRNRPLYIVRKRDE